MKKLMALFVTIVMILAMAVPAMATSTPVNQGKTQYSQWDGTVDGKEFKLDKYLLVPEGSKVPNVTFEYTLETSNTLTTKTPDPLEELIAATDTTAVVYKGIDAEKVKVLEGKTEGGNSYSYIGVMPFSESTDTLKEATDAEANGHVPEGYQFVRKDIVLDFSDVTFPEPGIYRYFLQESCTGDYAKLVQMDTEVNNINYKTWRTIDVYVLDDEDPTSHTLINDNADPNPSDTEPPYPNKPSHYIVYEGKLTVEAPKLAPNAYTDPDDYNPDRNLSGYDILNTEWTYVKNGDDSTPNPDGTYVYHFDRATGQWEETYTDNATPAVTTINRNRDTYLKKATATFTGANKTAETYNDAVQMGADEDDIHSAIWTLVDSSNVTHTWEWDDALSRWNHKAVSAKTEVPAPDNGARATVMYKGPAGAPNVEHEYSYEEAKEQEKYIDGELTQYDWVLTNAGTKTVYTYENNKWVMYTETEDQAEPDDAATTDPSLIVADPKVTYEYADAAEKKAQRENGYRADETPNGAEAGKKSDCYVNKFAAYKLEVGKKVTGNQGSRDKYFKFTIKVDTSHIVDGASEYIHKGHKLWIDRVDSIMTLNQYDATATDNGDPANAATDKSYTKGVIRQANSNHENVNGTVGADAYVIGDDGTVTITVYLHDGEKVVLRDLPEGAKYTVTENDGNKDGYLTTAELYADGDVLTDDQDGDGNRILTVPPANEIVLPTAGVNNEAQVEDSSIMANAGVTFVNTRNGVIPTGVAIGVGGAVGLLALAAVYFVLRRKLSVED